MAGSSPVAVPGNNRTMNIGLSIQVAALLMLTVPAAWLTIPWVMGAQALSGIAKDLNKMSAKSSIKLLVSDGQQGRFYQWIVGHSLQVVAKEDVAAHRQAGFFHELLQMLDGGAAELRKVFGASKVFAEPAAEGGRAGFGMEEAPAFSSLGVIAFVELLNQLVAGLALDEFAGATVQNIGASDRKHFNFMASPPN